MTASATAGVRGFRRSRAPERIVDVCVAASFGAVLFAPLGALPRACTYALAVLTLCRLAVWRRLPKTLLTWLAGLLLGYLVASIGWSGAVEPALAARFCVRALVVATFVAAFADCVRRGDAQRRICRWFALCGGLAAAFALVGFWWQPPAMGRLTGPGQIGNELIAGQAFTACALVALAALGAGNRFWRGALLASAAAAALAVALTGARSCWAALAVGVGALAIGHAARTPRRFALLAATWLAALAALVAVLMWSDATRGWLLPRGGSFRLAIWQPIFADTAGGPLWFGRGLLADGAVTAGDFLFLHPHSVYLAVFHQGGVIGLALLCAVLGAAAWRLLKRLAVPDARLGLALLTAGATVWLFDGHQLIHKVGVVWWLFWLPVASAIGLGAGADGGVRRHGESPAGT